MHPDHRQRIQTQGTTCGGCTFPGLGEQMRVGLPGWQGQEAAMSHFL